jgi:hypothetical protein
MDVSTILKRAAEKSGFTRFRYKERNIPTSVENVTVLPFFGDRRSSFVLSSLLLRRIKEELKGSRYFVLASWPGDEGLYPYVDEYWQVEDLSSMESLKEGCRGFSNSSSFVPIFNRSLNQYFYDVMSEVDIAQFYDGGLKSDFFDRFRHVKVYLPSIPSSSSLGPDISKALSKLESKVFIRPSRLIQSWRSGAFSSEKAPKEFWLSLLESLVADGFSPVVSCDPFSYDLSSDFSGPCLYLREPDAMKTLSVMRACGCVLDMFSGDSRMALAARCPFLCFDERQRFNSLKEFEVNDLCGRGVPKDYIYSFAALVDKGSPTVWKSNIFDHMSVRLRSLLANSERDSWPAPVESYEIVPYDSVRKKKLKRLGTRFIRIERD